MDEILMEEDYFESEIVNLEENEFNNSYNEVLEKFAETLVDTDHVVVYENGTIGVYGNVNTIFEEALVNKDSKKRAVRQTKAAMKKLFKEKGEKLRYDWAFGCIGEIAFVNGSSDTFAMTFTKKGRHLVTLALAGAAGAGLGAASLVCPPAAAAAPIIGATLAMKDLSEDEKDLTMFLQHNMAAVVKAVNDNLDEYKVTAKQVKGSAVILFTYKSK